MAERLNVKVDVVVTDAADGSDFVRSTLDYSGVPYEMFVEMEKAIMESMKALASDAVEKKRPGKNKNK
jgi:hypothetical protein